MIGPTSLYDAFPTKSPEEAADMLIDALVNRPKTIDTRLGTFGGADAYEPDDVCPRPVTGSGSVTRPAGVFPEHGCGAPLGKKTFGAPVVVDVVVPASR